MYRTDLYRNSFWLMASSAISSALGFFFWTIAARLYAERDVGLASTLISSVNLLVAISSLGFGITFARFLPTEKNKKEIINPCITISGLLILILSLAFSLSSKYLSDEISFLRNPLYLAAFPVFALFTLQNGFLDTIYVSQKVSFFTFIKNLLQAALKIVFLLPLMFLGTFGIFSSYGMATIISFSVSFLIFMRIAIPDYGFSFSFSVGNMKGLFRFAFANYIATLLGGLATTLFPLIITTTVSPEMTAYFYVAWMIGALIHIIPYSVAFNFLTVGAAGGDVESKLKKAVKFTMLLLVPVVLFTLVAARHILLLFGESYAQNGATLLRILALASFPVAINSMGISRLNLKNKIIQVVFINAFFTSVTIGGGYLLLARMGLLGIGLALLLSQSIVALGFLARNAYKLRRDLET